MVLWKAWANMPTASPSSGAKILNEPVLVQAGSGQPDAEEGGIEGMLPADQNDPDESQGKQPAPAALLESVGVNIVGIFGGGKSQGGHPGINNAVQDRIKFAAEDEENSQDSQPFEGFLHQGGDERSGGEIAWRRSNW